MRIQTVSPHPLHLIPYQRAGASGQTESAFLPLLQGFVDHLPAPLEALVCTGDLQGMAVNSNGEPALLGEVLAQELPVLLELLNLSPARTGIILTGDLYSSPQANQRGASGDVRAVWNAFQPFRWVAGISGNHDQFGATPEEHEAFTHQPHIHHLDGTTCQLDGLKLGGISGIIGNPDKPLRRPALQYLTWMTKLVQTNPDLLLLHPSPATAQFSGSTELGAHYNRQPHPLTICGHISWPTPLVELPNQTQLLNVDSRAVILSQAQL